MALKAVKKNNKRKIEKERKDVAVRLKVHSIDGLKTEYSMKTGQWSRFKKNWHKVWYFIWEDDSWASWFVNVILAFILIKFVVYPVLGLLFSTSHPIVAVVSGSMEHDGDFEEWWASKAVCDRTICSQAEYYSREGIGKGDFKQFPFKNGFNKGDLMILYGTEPKNIGVGDVIVFVADRPDPIIHRVIEKKYAQGSGEEYVYQFFTKGDNNAGSFYFEKEITEDRYIGKAALRIPFLGYIKIGFVSLLAFVFGLI